MVTFPGRPDTARLEIQHSMITTRRLFGLALTLLLVPLGCSAPTPPDGNIVALGTGRTFEYQSSGEFQGSEVSGEVTRQFAQAKDEFGRPYWNQKTTNVSRTNGLSKTIILTTYLRQDDTGSWYELGSSESGWLKEPILCVASPLKIGWKSSTSSTYSSGTTRTDEIAVTQVEQVTVPAGTYTAFVVENTHHSARGDLLIKEWWVPSVGRPVKTEFSDAQMELTLELVNVSQAED